MLGERGHQSEFEDRRCERLHGRVVLLDGTSRLKFSQLQLPSPVDYYGLELVMALVLSSS